MNDKPIKYKLDEKNEMAIFTSCLKCFAIWWTPVISKQTLTKEVICNKCKTNLKLDLNWQKMEVITSLA